MGINRDMVGKRMTPTQWEYKGVTITRRGEDYLNYYIGDDPQGHARLEIAKEIIDKHQS